MALSQEEKQIVQFGKDSGKSKSEVMLALSKYRSQPTAKTTSSFTRNPISETVSAIKDAPSDIKETFSSMVGSVDKGMATQDEARTQVETGEISPLAGTVKTIGGGLGAGAGIVGNAFTGLLKLFTSPEAEEDVKSGISKTVDFVKDTPIGKETAEAVKEMTTNYNNLTPEKKAIVDGLLGAGSAVAEVVGIGKGKDVLKGGFNQAKSLFAKDIVATSVDDLITKADDVLKQTEAPIVRETGGTTPSEILATAKTEAPKLTLKEKWIGISPDIKKRLEGKQEQLKEYFDIAHARNLDDTLDTPYAYGARKVDDTVKQMEKLLSETGSDIGSTRQKLGTYKASIDQVKNIENTFTNELSKLNLEVRNGKVVQKAGTVPKLGSNSDLKVINDLYSNLQVAKQSPTLTNLIDLRAGFDNKINFGKRASEVSSSVDSLSRQTRRSIADEAGKLVGKTEAGKLKEYSDFMDAYGELKSFTDRKAGSEYLLRLVLSGRGREASELLATINKHTGTDLMDDATMMTIATDLIGNTRQQNLFRQEVTKAGLDVAQLASGKGTGAVGLLTDFATKRLLDEEKIFLEASKARTP